MVNRETANVVSMVSVVIIVIGAGVLVGVTVTVNTTGEIPTENGCMVNAVKSIQDVREKKDVSWNAVASSSVIW